MKKESGLWISNYWHPALAVDAVVFGFNGSSLSVLLIKRRRNADAFPDTWALPGGFIRSGDESLKAAICRELKEEASLKGVDPVELQTFSRKNRDPRERVISIAFYALVRLSEYKKIKGGGDAEKAKWYPVNDLPTLAFDHAEIIETALERLQRSIHFEPIGFELLDERFTMSQLQKIYLAILDPLGKGCDTTQPRGVYDRRNFMKKMLNLKYIKDTGLKQTGTPWRAPSLYTFDKEKYDEVKKIGMRLEF